MTGLTSERLAELRRIASAATPGPWVFGGCAVWQKGSAMIADMIPCRPYRPKDEIEANARHISAFDPTTALALLDEIDHLRKQRDTLLSGISNIADDVLALLDRIEELEAVLRLVYDEFVLDAARWCRHCRLRIDDHAPECPMAEVERVLGLEGGATDA